MSQKKPTYWELLQHPEWQKKRLAILEAAGWECSQCGAKDKTFHVHHGYYEKGLKPWEYPDESLHCVCDDCHTEIEGDLLKLRRQIGRLSPCYAKRLAGYARGLELLDQLEDLPKDIVLDFEGEDIEYTFGLCAAFDLFNFQGIEKSLKETDYKLPLIWLVSFQKSRTCRQPDEPVETRA